MTTKTLGQIYDDTYIAKEPLFHKNTREQRDARNVWLHNEALQAVASHAVAEYKKTLDSQHVGAPVGNAGEAGSNPAGSTPLAAQSILEGGASCESNNPESSPMGAADCHLCDDTGYYGDNKPGIANAVKEECSLRKKSKPSEDQYLVVCGGDGYSTCIANGIEQAIAEVARMHIGSDEDMDDEMVCAIMKHARDPDNWSCGSTYYELDNEDGYAKIIKISPQIETFFDDVPAQES
jgi:hypothetical protein